MYYDKRARTCKWSIAGVFVLRAKNSSNNVFWCLLKKQSSVEFMLYVRSNSVRDRVKEMFFYWGNHYAVSNKNIWMIQLLFVILQWM